MARQTGDRMNPLDADDADLRPLSTTWLPPRALVGFLVALLAILLVAWLSYRTLVERSDSSAEIRRTNQVMAQVDEVMSTVKDLETGQRGFLLTGDEDFLEPYFDAEV